MTKDQIELLRPGFEAAIIERFKESGFLEVEIRVECLSRTGEIYLDPVVSMAWWAWCLSRERMVVELPEAREDGWGQWSIVKDETIEAIEAVGGTVKS
jgi:hypothetical protein